MSRSQPLISLQNPLRALKRYSNIASNEASRDDARNEILTTVSGSRPVDIALDPLGDQSHSSVTHGLTSLIAWRGGGRIFELVMPSGQIRHHARARFGDIEAEVGDGGTEDEIRAWVA